MTIKVTENIWFQELVPKQYWVPKKKITERDLRFIDRPLISDIQKIREHFNKPLIINNQVFNWRGLRTPDYDRFNPNSMHAWWRAFDFHIVGVDVEEVRQYIIKHRDKLFPNIKAIEDKVNWIHVDSRFLKQDELLVFNP
jgi:hypothetical protein